jgi:cysteinyl-tRNA synthetase
MELKLYDTLTREKRRFDPIDPKRVRMYVCGPTVYDFAHIGNARPVIVFDVLFRLLRHLYGADHVTYVRNITDVDDKINARAAERGISIRELTEETYKNFAADVAALGCLTAEQVNLSGKPPVFIEPRATEHIEEMKTLIERLIANGCAYVAEDHVLFEVKKMADYGKLARRSLDEMMAGARVEVAPYKRDAMDFVLWKPSKPGEPGWPSPAGIKTPGRPGWHIECSAMSWKHLGETFDIHGGGIDLVFPHHENEIAQSRCAFHEKVMANFWMHNGFLQVEGEKMSKSLGNFTIIRDVLADWPGDVVRLNMLKTHYRQPIDWTISSLKEADSILRKWDATIADAEWPPELVLDGELKGRFVEALLDDLNTPLAISELHRMHDWARRFRHDRSHADVPRFLAALSLLGFQRMANSHDDSLTMGLATRLDHFSTLSTPIDRETISKMVDSRNAARKAKNFAESDRIRDELAKMGVVLKDSKDGTTWEVAR